jgi:hypothetical protein
VFSSPLELWVKPGNARPNPQLPATLHKAQAFGAAWLKVSLGYFTEHCDLHTLSPCSTNNRCACWWKTTRPPRAGASSPCNASSMQWSNGKPRSA